MSAPKCKSCGKKIGEGGWLVCLRPNDGADWLCGRQACEDKYNGDEPPKGKRQRVLEVTDGVPIVEKAKATADEYVPGNLFEDGASRVLRVESTTGAGVAFRVMVGRGRGSTTTLSVRGAGFKPVTKEDLAARLEAARAAAGEEDEAQCEKCWPAFEPGEDVADKSKMGRDPSCTNHELKEKKMAKAKTDVKKEPKPKAEPKPKPTAEEKKAAAAKDSERWSAVKKALKAKSVALPEPGKGYRERLTALAKANGVEIP